MSQVIEVQFYNPETSERLHKAFTRCVSKDQHKEAIGLTLRDFSGGHATLASTDLIDPEKFDRGYWGSVYDVVFTTDMYEGEREMYAVLYAQYPKGKINETSSKENLGK